MDEEITSKVSKYNLDTHLHNILKDNTLKHGHLFSDHYLASTQFCEIKNTLRRHW